MSSRRHSANDSKPEIIKVHEQAELLAYLYNRLKERSRSTVKSLLVSRRILLNGKLSTQFDQAIKPGDEISILSTPQREVSRKLPGIQIVFEDNDIIVINKEVGVLSMSTESRQDDTAYSILSRYVKMQNRENKIYIVHRLDRDTSGIMMFAKNVKAKETMQANWQHAVEERTYIAVVEGCVEQKTGTIESWLRESKALIVHSSQTPGNGLHAITHFKTLKSNKYFSLLAVELETGRKNQIRVHAQAIGHSVIGDKKYGSKQNPIGRLGLHAQILAFKHPVSGENLRFETAIPRKFLSLFE